jgi:hypothetical protein
MNAKKLVFLCSSVLVVVMMLTGMFTQPVSAAPLGWPKSGEITCQNAYASITNDTQNTLIGYGWIKANGSYVVGPITDNDVDKNETFTVNWTPPANFSGSVEAHVELWKGIQKQDENTVKKNNISCIQHTPVTLCHKNQGVKSFNQITVDDDAVVSQGHTTHQDGQDIIPPFTYWNGQTFPGQNWDTEGQSIWNSGCVADYKEEVKIIKNDCDGWQIAKIYLVNGVEYDRKTESGVWTKPYASEEKVTVFGVEIVRKADCQQTHKVTWKIVPIGCDRVEATFKIDDGEATVYASKDWTNPLVLETANFEPYDFPKNPDELYDFMQIPAQYAAEDAKCQTTNNVTWKIIPRGCNGVDAAYAINGGEWKVYGSQDWTNPLVLETANFEPYDFPKNPNELYNVTLIPEQTATEDEKCLKNVATFEIKAACGTVTEGSWMVVTINSPRSTVYIIGQTIHGSAVLTRENTSVDYVVVADEGYTFANGSTEIKGTLAKIEKCWINPPRSECPTCGPNHQHEVALKEGNVVITITSQTCTDCFKGRNYGHIVSDTAIHARWDVAQFQLLVPVSEKVFKNAGLVEGVDYRIDYVGRHKIKQVYLLAKPFDGLDKVYWELNVPIAWTTNNGYVVYDMNMNRLDGFGKNIVDKYVACGDEYGPWFIEKSGEMQLPKLLNINSWDVGEWLVKAGYFPNMTEAQIWLSKEKWDNALQTGIIGQLPAKP